MTAASLTTVPGQDKQGPAGPLKYLTIARHLVGWTVAWWFFAKILPVFVHVCQGLGIAVSQLGSILIGLSDYSTLYGPWLVPMLMAGDLVFCQMLQRRGGQLWQRRWTLAVEAILFATVATGMLVFGIPVLRIWAAGHS